MTENYYTQADYGTILTIVSSTHGCMMFIIDDDDVEKIKQYKWCIQRCKHNYNTADKFYVKATSKRNILLHRYIIEAKKGDVVDHVNGNTFDNRKCNLRIGSYSDNNFNRVKNARKSKKSIIGVAFYPYQGKWHAYIGDKSLGYFKTEEEAIEARRAAEKVRYTKRKVKP